MYSDNDDNDDGGFKDGGFFFFFFLAPAAASAAATSALTAVVCGKSGRGEEVVAEVEKRTNRIKGVGCERNWVGNGLRRVYVMSLYLWLALECVLLGTAAGYRPLKDGALAFDNSLWLNEGLFTEGGGGAVGPYSMLNITGTYKGTWGLRNGNLSGKFPAFKKTAGNIIFELISSATDLHGIHYVQGEVVLRDGVYISDGDLQMKMEGVYIWPFRQLRMVLTSSMDSDLNREEDFVQSSPYHLLGVFSSQVLKDSPRDYSPHLKKSSSIAEMGKTCSIQLVTQVSTVLSDNKQHEQQVCEIQGLVEAPMMDNERGECFSPLVVNATSVNVSVYYNKAVNYTLMVTFISFLQVLFLIRQMEHSNTQSGAAKVSLLMVGQQAIMDAYLCLLHLTAGILVESLFNAFATAAFFKFVIFAIFEMRYLLAIWKARRPVASGEGWETMRRELSVLYSRFYGFLLGGILIMYELHNLLRYILLFFYSFWIPQIVANVVRDARKPLHPHYIVGITVTRLAIPLYAFGCPSNFMGVETNIRWCIGLTTFLGLQSAILLLQHYFGPRCFIPRQMLPEKYSYFRRVERSNTRVAGADETAVVDCVICMASVDMAQRSTECMVTPCDHFFHTGCLQRWMDIKMECPTCRRPLPPM
ncbi:unnamed protein product [Sphagnum jensenii]|uniref:RING-type E3 ubiquitin transferase n=1 Tax=Sphagnum jensenii TaxID=128206 RepID=A0ABP0VZA1_9BRYO